MEVESLSGLRLMEEEGGSEGSPPLPLVTGWAVGWTRPLYHACLPRAAKGAGV